ncbi:MAG: class I SAM-dependent methyltransferase [Promethearchaeota archaeon]
MSTKNEKLMNNFGFKMMSAMFALRDLINDPVKKINKAGVTKQQRVLDYGCGPGAYTIAAARVVGESGKIFAADIHPLAIKKVLKKAAKYRLDNIETIKTSCDTGLADESIDLIMCFDMFHSVKNQIDLLKEFHRVLKPNSILSMDCHHLSDIKARVEESGLFELVEKKGETFNFIKI